MRGTYQCILVALALFCQCIHGARHVRREDHEYEGYQRDVHHRDDEGYQRDFHHRDDEGYQRDSHHRDDEGYQRDSHHRDDEGYQRDSYHRDDEGYQRDAHHRDDEGYKRDAHHRDDYMKQDHELEDHQRVNEVNPGIDREPNVEDSRGDYYQEDHQREYHPRNIRQHHESGGGYRPIEDNPREDHHFAAYDHYPPRGERYHDMMFQDQFVRRANDSEVASKKNYKLFIDKLHAKHNLREKILWYFNGDQQAPTYETSRFPIDKAVSLPKLAHPECPNHYKNCISNSYPSICRIPPNTNADLWNIRFTLYFDLPHDQQKRESTSILKATLMLKKYKRLPVHPRLLVIQLYAYRRSLTKKRDKKYIVANTTVASDFLGWISIDLTNHIDHVKHKNFGYLIKVQEKISGIEWDEDYMFLSNNCTDVAEEDVPILVPYDTTSAKEIETPFMIITTATHAKKHENGANGDASYMQHSSNIRRQDSKRYFPNIEESPRSKGVDEIYKEELASYNSENYPNQDYTEIQLTGTGDFDATIHKKKEDSDYQQGGSKVRNKFDYNYYDLPNNKNIDRFPNTQQTKEADHSPNSRGTITLETEQQDKYSPDFYEINQHQQQPRNKNRRSWIEELPENHHSNFNHHKRFEQYDHLPDYSQPRKTSRHRHGRKSHPHFNPNSGKPSTSLSHSS